MPSSRLKPARAPGGPSLVWKILLSTAVAITLLLAVAGWLVQNQTRSTLSGNLESELQGSFHAYESLWQARTDMLRSVSLVLSTMSDVRAAFNTRDRATIQDTAAEIWSKISQSSALFLVTDPRGEVIASLGGGDVLGNRLDVVREAAQRFPKQTAGFAVEGDRLYELVVTPVYVQSEGGQGLLNVLVAGFPVDRGVAMDLKRQTGGSDFVFLAGGKPLASTFSPAESLQIAQQYRRDKQLQHITISDGDFAVLGTTLPDIEGAPAGDLLIVQTFNAISRSVDALQRQLFLIWAGAVLAGLAVSVVLASRILQPIRQLDEAASLIARQEYSTRVPEGSNDELGRLAHTFNTMCQSIQDARGELIRQERILTIGRLSSSIAHDLRNPLASIYGGAEMMMDGNLNEAQMHRLAGTIYRSSRVINDLLQELLDVSRGRIQAPETCRLSEIVVAAIDVEGAQAEQQGVNVRTSIDASIELPLERARMERVFLNLITNAVEAMPNGGTIDIRAERDGTAVIVKVDDTGPGIPDSVRNRLFEPFVTSRKNGLGLGLALSRQTVLEHGGDLWVEDAGTGGGAHFRLRLPL
ncbi:MAG TPA: ATP-binding protein [Bryobacteraceae bacterium]|nr:ATP-binding protein [Bryobacteraceae bacterium]